MKTYRLKAGVEVAGPTPPWRLDRNRNEDGSLADGFTEVACQPEMLLRLGGKWGVGIREDAFADLFEEDAR